MLLEVRLVEDVKQLLPSAGLSYECSENALKKRFPTNLFTFGDGYVVVGGKEFTFPFINLAFYEEIAFQNGELTASEAYEL